MDSSGLSHEKESRYRFGGRLIWVLKEATSAGEKKSCNSSMEGFFLWKRDFERLSFEGLRKIQPEIGCM